MPSWADQLLPQLLKEQFDTLPLQCRRFFTDPYCGGGVSNKHCLLTFFICDWFVDKEVLGVNLSPCI